MPPVTLYVLFTYCIFYRKYATATQEKFAFVISCRPLADSSSWRRRACVVPGCSMKDGLGFAMMSSGMTNLRFLYIAFFIANMQE
jgi:hypothetical protein